MMDAVTPTVTPTQDLAAGLRLTVTRLARLMRQQSDAGLTPTQLAAMATIDRCGPLPIGTLADEEQIGAPTATKIVDKLAAAGYVERRPDASDRRVALVSTTATGRALLTEVRARKTAWLLDRLEDLGPEDRDRLQDAVEILERLTTPHKPARPEVEP